MPDAPAKPKPVAPPRDDGGRFREPRDGGKITPARPRPSKCANGCGKTVFRIFCSLDCAEERWSIQQEAFDVLQSSLDDALLEAGRPRQGALAIAAAAAAVYDDPG